MLDAELEYQRARKAYDKALKRLQMAKANRPPPAKAAPIPRVSRTHKETNAEKDACWAMYLAGERDPKALAKRFNHTAGWARNLIHRYYRARQFGPETKWEYQRRMKREEYERWNAERLSKLTKPEPSFPLKVREHLRKGGAVILT